MAGLDAEELNASEKKGALERSPAAHESLPCCGRRAGVERDLRLADELKVVLELEALVRPLGCSAVEFFACPGRLVGYEREEIRQAGTQARLCIQIPTLAGLLEKSR